MALLMAAALFFGNCLSCPQMLLAAQSHQPRHNCCPGPRQVSASCQSQGMQHFVKAESGGQPFIPPAAAELIEAPASIVLPNAALSVPAVAGDAPPGALSLRI